MFSLDVCKNLFTLTNPELSTVNPVSEIHFGAEIGVTKKLNFEFIIVPFVVFMKSWQNSITSSFNITLILFFFKKLKIVF